MQVLKGKDPFDDIYELRDRVLAELTSDNDNDVRNASYKLRSKIRNCANRLCLLKQYYNDLKFHIANLEETEKGLNKSIANLERSVAKQQKDMEKAKYSVLYTPDEQKEVIDKYWKYQRRLQTEEKKVEKKYNELIIKQDELKQAVEDTNLALSSHYRLSETERELFENDRGYILDGVEKFGTLSLAVRNDGRIKTRLSAIMYYAEKHPAFKQDLAIAKQIFKENLDSTILERAIDGTENPVFQKGEYIGDYKVRDNKLLVEVAKANLPEKYDRKAYNAQHPVAQTNNTVNIVNYSDADETKLGYVKNIGLVKDVDDTGKVKRITQEKKLCDFYSKKEGAEVVIPSTDDVEIIEGEDG